MKTGTDVGLEAWGRRHGLTDDQIRAQLRGLLDWAVRLAGQVGRSERGHEVTEVREEWPRDARGRFARREDATTRRATSGEG